MNTALKIGLAIGGIFLTYKVGKVVSAAMVAMGMAIEINPETKVDMTGILLTTNIDISNPTDSSMLLSSPFVQLFHDKVNLANNKVSSKQFEIKPFTKTRLPIKLKLTWEQIKDLLDTIDVNFPSSYTNFQRIMWMYNNYKQVLNKLGLVVRYSTYANGINYKDEQTIKI